MTERPPAFATPETDETEAETPASPARQWLLPAVAGGIAVAILAGAALISYSVLSAQHSPEARVTEFLQSLVDGDATTAAEQLTDLSEHEPDLLTQRAYDAATDHITGFTVTNVHADGDHAAVHVAVVQGKSNYTTTIDLVRTGHEGLFDVWSVDAASLPALSLDFARPSAARLAVNGIAYPDFSSERATSIPAFPGTYVFDIARPVDGLEVEPATVEATFVTPGGDLHAVVGVTLSEAGADLAREAIADHERACFSQAVMSPTGGCGFAVTGDGSGYTNQRWTTVTAPVIEFGPWTEAGAEVRVVSPGTLRWDADIDGGTAESVFNTYQPAGWITDVTSKAAEFASSYAP